MMMDRGHLEDALAMRQLEVAHLQDIGQRLNDVDEAHKQQHERHIERIGKAAHRAAEIQRAGVAHKRLGGVEIIEQEAAERADKKRVGVVVDVSRSEMYYNLLYLLDDKTITLEDLAGFSPDLRERLAMIARDHFV